MFIETTRASRRAIAAARSRADLVERRLHRFRPEVQTRVRDVAARHPWIADLSVSFPALLFALAFPRARIDAARAIALVIAGEPLLRVASAAGVPAWLRRFPAEAFASPIPALPDSTDFGRRVANHKPCAWRDASRWLDLVSHACIWGDEEIALWLAREAPPPVNRRRRRYARDDSKLVCLWAWFGSRWDTRASTFMKTRWNANMKWRAAVDGAWTWREALQPQLLLGHERIADSWLAPGIVDGFEFRPISSAGDLDAEAEVMSHCVRSYAANIADNHYRVWSVRRDGERVATLSLRSLLGAPFPEIAELAGAGNAPAPVEVWLAARQWALTQAPSDPSRFAYKSYDYDPAVWRALWRPYWLAKRRIPAWLPLNPELATDVL